MFLEGLRSKNSIVELCLREGINQNQYYRWSKEFMEDRGDQEAHRSFVDGLIAEGTEPEG